MNANNRYSNLKKPPVARLSGKDIPEKTSTINQNIIYEKRSQLAGNNIVYNPSNPPKPKIPTLSNKTVEDLRLNQGNSKNKTSDVTDIFKGIKPDVMINKYSKNLYDLNSNLNDIDNYNNNSGSNYDKTIKELKDEINALLSKNKEKDRLLKDRDRLIKELVEHNKKLEKEITVLRVKESKNRERDRERDHDKKDKHTEEEELLIALAKINEMEKKQLNRANRQVENRSTSVHRPFQNPIGINFHPSDIIDINNFGNDPIFAEMFGNIHHHMVDPLASNEINAEYEDHIINELCPNPDRMTYEQLLELEDKVGKVSKGLSLSDIEKVPTIKFNKIMLKNNDKCTICQFEYTENETLRKLTCNHIYHKPCVDEWLLKEKTCPVCKMEVKVKK